VIIIAELAKLCDLYFLKLDVLWTIETVVDMLKNCYGILIGTPMKFTPTQVQKACNKLKVLFIIYKIFIIYLTTAILCDTYRRYLPKMGTLCDFATPINLFRRNANILNK
jgi:hypothetical protein